MLSLIKKSLFRTGFFAQKSILLIFVLLSFALASCSADNQLPAPSKLTKDTQCSACGMVIAKYAGPHAQIVWKNGKTSFYGNLLEAMPEILQKATNKRIAAIYVQDFSNLKWASYYGKWINAKDAIFVVDSSKLGSMGISYTPFKTQQAAQAFQKTNGGKILRFAQLTQEVVDNSNELMRKKPDVYMPAASGMPKSIQPVPGKLTSNTQCSACGMVIEKYAGPHAQIVWKNGKTSFYGNLLEAMPPILYKPTARKIAAIYVQDFSNLPWASYYGKWINAKNAIFVVDSNKLDSMGISYTPFKTQQAAQAFQKTNGGKILRFAQLTQEVVDNSNELMRTNPGVYMPKTRM